MACSMCDGKKKKKTAKSNKMPIRGQRALKNKAKKK
tara:strand:+ start:693 stop:800 length:108 start_codon:yes stop_codon:yes gene_type:complete